MDLYITDPEFAERFEHFAFHEVINEENQQVDEKTRTMAILSVLIGCGGMEAFREMLPKALESSMTPIAVKEIVYQATDYLGYGRMLPFLKATNEIFIEKGIQLPLDDQATTTIDNRLEKGIDLRRTNERGLESGSYQSLAGSKLFRRLLHPQGVNPC